MAPVTASSAARKSPAGKNRVLVTAAVEPPPPSEAERRPSMVRLTTVLAVCFLAGVAWPIAGGLALTQRPPGSTPKAPEPETERAGESEPGSTLPAVPAMHAAPMAAARAPHIESRVVQSCESDAGEVLSRCDGPSLDDALEEPLEKLGACAGAQSGNGTLSLGMYLDFARGQIEKVKLGQSTTLSEQESTKLLACSERAIVGASLDDVEHAHARYWIYYVLRFEPSVSPGGTAASGAPGDVVRASGQATIGWKTAVVRESPSIEGPVATRLAYGTRVSVTGRAGDWYRIERSGKALGWVHRDALGL